VRSYARATNVARLHTLSRANALLSKRLRYVSAESKSRGVLLRRLREDRRLDQAEAAERLGIHRVTLSRIERGETESISLDLAQRMGELYGPRAREILIGDATSRSGDVSRETSARVLREGPAEAPRAPRQRMAPKAYKQVYEYLSRMEKAGVVREAIDEAERLFTRDNYGQLYSGKRELTEDEQLQVVEASWSFIREVILITQGIRLDAPIRRGPSSYDELPTEPKTPPEVTKPSRGQRKA
jgi:transcriptional regulator with XRE-family HTH domain